MSYFGAAPTGNFISTASQRVTGSTNNYVDLDHAISALSDVIVLVNSVKQDITNLTFTSASRITLGGTLVSSDVVEIIYLGKSVATQTPGTATVTNDMLVNSSITLNGSAVSLGGSATVGGNNKPLVSVYASADTSMSDNTSSASPRYVSDKPVSDTSALSIGSALSDRTASLPVSGTRLSIRSISAGSKISERGPLPVSPLRAASVRATSPSKGSDTISEHAHTALTTGISILDAPTSLTIR